MTQSDPVVSIVDEKDGSVLEAPVLELQRPLTGFRVLDQGHERFACLVTLKFALCGGQ